MTQRKPASPLDLAVIHSHGKYTAEAAHLQLLNQALVYLAQRKAPAGFLRRLRPTKPIAPSISDDDLMPFLRLIIEMPPRHAKSVTVSQYFTSWYIGMFPDHRVILTSYEDTFARSWGRKARNVLTECGELFGVELKGDTKAADEWETSQGGGMLTAGIGGAITGRGADCLIVDDPVKNARDAASMTMQQQAKDWWDSTASTRLEPGGIALVIQTRWHENDLTGQILAGEEDIDDEEEVWYELLLPALAEKDDPLGRKIGAALWPERYPVARLEARRKRYGSYYFSALYQQRPAPEEGSVFKRSWWQYYDSLPSGYHAGYNIIDTAGYDSKTTGDYAVVAPIVRVGKDLYWLKSFQRGHWEFPELVQRCRDLHDENGLPFLIEDVPWAKPLIQTLSQLLSGVVPFKIGGVNKLARAGAASPYAEAGNFYLPRNARWVPEFIEEHASFPNAAHDDQVDTTSMGALRLLQASLPTMARREQVQSSHRERMRQQQNAQRGWRQV